MRILLFICLYTCSFPLLAHFDLSVGGSFRSYPAIGLETTVESGYNYLLWGKVDKKKPFYGLIRPSLKLTTSAVVNNYDAKFEVFPISFLSITRGFKHINSNFNFPFFNCDTVRCRGDIKRDYTEVRLALAYKGVTFMGSNLLSNNSYDDPRNENKPVGEFRWVTLARADSDQLYVSRYVLGYSFGEGMIGVLTEYAHLAKSHQTYNMDLLVYVKNYKDSNYIFGIGQMYTTEQDRGIIGVFQMRKDIIPSSRLF